ncbi:MAG: Lrp/AsnC family transcriptional regulator [Alicyclobacillus sp.]|nr:Lrp/AsnC family transcriptional regulator [Alicyclobacillus sp.]
MEDVNGRNSAAEHIDPMDLAILKALSANGRASFQEVAQELGVSRVTVHERVKKLMQRGIIRGFHARIDPEALGYHVSAYVGLMTSQGKQSHAVIEQLQAIEEVEEIHIITGRLDVLVRIRARNHRHLQEILFEKIGGVTGFDRSETMIVLSSPKEFSGLNLDQIQPD